MSLSWWWFPTRWFQLVLPPPQSPPSAIRRADLQVFSISFNGFTTYAPWNSTGGSSGSSGGWTSTISLQNKAVFVPWETDSLFFSFLNECSLLTNCLNSPTVRISLRTLVGRWIISLVGTFVGRSTESTGQSMYCERSSKSAFELLIRFFGCRDSSQQMKHVFSEG